MRRGEELNGDGDGEEGWEEPNKKREAKARATFRGDPGVESNWTVPLSSTFLLPQRNFVAR